MNELRGASNENGHTVIGIQKTIEIDNISRKCL